VHHIKACAAEDGHPDIDPALDARLDFLVALLDGIYNRTTTAAGDGGGGSDGSNSTLIILVFVVALIAVAVFVGAVLAFGRGTNKVAPQVATAADHKKPDP